MKWDHKLTMRYSTHGWLGPRSAEVSVDSLSLAATTNYTIRHILPNIFTVHKYHGPKRETNPAKLRNFDIVFRTYATIAVEFCKGVSLIHQLEYYRLVLDEGKNMVRVGAQVQRGGIAIRRPLSQYTLYHNSSLDFAIIKS